MADHLADFLQLPSEFTQFAFGAGPGEGYARYVTNVDRDWPARSEVAVTVLTSRDMFPRVRSNVYELGSGRLPSEAQAREYFVTQEKILSGRLGLLGLKERVASTGVEERAGEWSLDLAFGIDVADDPIFGTFTRTHRLLYAQGDEPLMVDIRAVGRNRSRAYHDLLANELDPASLRLGTAFENAHEQRSEAVPELLRMEAEGIPVPEMTRDMVEHLAKNLRATLPELHPVGHIVSRSNILLWHVLGEGSAISTAELESWSTECARLALDLPDQWFRHFVCSSITTRSGLMLGEEAQGVSPHEIEGLIRYASVLRHLSSTNEPTAQQGEVTALITWVLQALQNVADIGVCRQVCQAVSEIEGDDVSLNLAVENAVEQAAQFAQRRGDSTEAALHGIRRSELAAAILQAASARRRFDAGGNNIHSALFGKLHQYNFHYQGMLYGLDADGVNAGLARAGAGMPPGVLYLRPLSTLRSVFVPIKREKTELYPVATLEAALTNCVAPLFQATNAVGGLGDILGMQRSDFAGEGEAGWQLLVSSLMDISGAIIVLPDDSDGVSWEIGQIAERDLLGKCIFVLLPSDLEWSDQGNRLGFARAFRIENAALDRDGGFFVGDPRNGLLLPWKAQWDGNLSRILSKMLKLSR